MEPSPWRELLVVQVGDSIACSFAAKLMVDLGCECVLVELPAISGGLRSEATVDDGADLGPSAVFTYLNWSKKSVTCDYARREGLAQQEASSRLARGASGSTAATRRTPSRSAPQTRSSRSRASGSSAASPRGGPAPSIDDCLEGGVGRQQLGRYQVAERDAAGGATPGRLLRWPLWDHKTPSALVGWSFAPPRRRVRLPFAGPLDARRRSTLHDDAFGHAASSRKGRRLRRRPHLPAGRRTRRPPPRGRSSGLAQSRRRRSRAARRCT